MTEAASSGLSETFERLCWLSLGLLISCLEGDIPGLVTRAGQGLSFWLTGAGFGKIAAGYWEILTTFRDLPDYKTPTKDYSILFAGLLFIL